MRPKRYPASLAAKAACIFIICLLCRYSGKGQPGPGVDHLTDSLKKSLSQAQTDSEKNYWMLKLATSYTAFNPELSEDYARQAMQVAELSRDRKLIINTYLSNGRRYLNRANLSNYLQQALSNFLEAQKMAQANNLDDELAYSYIHIASAYRAMGDDDKALKYNDLAHSIAAAGNNDSLKVTASNSLGDTYSAKNEMLLAFRNYLDALNIAELSKRDELLSLSCTTLAGFYAGIDDYDKSIDYGMQVIHIDERNNNLYKLFDDYNFTGRLFVGKKQYDVALQMFEKAIALADSLGIPMFKILPYSNISNMYFDHDQIDKGLAYLNSHQQLLDYFKVNQLGFFLDEGYGFIYTKLGKLDSAAYFYARTAPQMEQHASGYVKSNFYVQYGQYFMKSGQYPQAITYFQQARQMGESMKDLNTLETSSKYLDSLYRLTGDFKNALQYNTDYNLYKDSIKNLAKATDLLKLEVDNDNKRRERLVKEEEEKTEHRHNVQYMGITAGIASLFIVMVMMGFFVVSPRTIRALGFFSFIFLFEFVILLADKQIHEWTHGEPWKILFIKIGLAAILLPLHHWLEHKVIHYLTTRKKIAAHGFLGAGRLLKGKKAETVHPA
ncbi:MAG TPA: tetratricopeptide repeat protein [Chitinophagaceae bacterium]